MAMNWAVEEEKAAIFALTAELAAIDGPAGFEGPVVRRLLELFRPLADELTQPVLRLERPGKPAVPAR